MCTKPQQEAPVYLSYETLRWTYRYSSNV